MAGSGFRSILQRLRQGGQVKWDDDFEGFRVWMASSRASLCVFIPLEANPSALHPLPSTINPESQPRCIIPNFATLNPAGSSLRFEIPNHKLSTLHSHPSKLRSHA